jgi:hypothetical protein
VHGKLVKSLNMTFISLIPMKVGAVEVRRLSTYQSGKGHL